MILELAMQLLMAPYLEQASAWPAAGQHLLAQYDDHEVIVYQAYCPDIGLYAAHYKRFGSAFSFIRMSWIKPSFLWMMFRSAWATKAGQEVILAVHLRREAFDAILSQAVHSTFVPEIYGDIAAWKRAVEESEVRVQWDPDHDPVGAKLARRTIQLGLRGQVLGRYATEWLADVEDITGFVREQRGRKIEDMWTPVERPYPIVDPTVATRLQTDL